MFGIFVANTKGFIAKFTVSFAIKFFSYWYLKYFKKRHPEFGWMKMEDLPTHALIGYDIGLTGQKYIFESAPTQQMRDYYPSKYEFEYDPVDIELFIKCMKKSQGEPYGVFQLYYFIKTFIWMTCFSWLVPLWSKLFHANKPILKWGNPFVWFRICTETAAELMGWYSDARKLPVTKLQLTRANINNILPIVLFDWLLTIWKNGEINFTKRG